MSKHNTGFKLRTFFRMSKEEGERRLNRNPPAKGEWVDQNGIPHKRSRMSASWSNGRGIDHSIPQP